jgi:hypothetical protein
MVSSSSPAVLCWGLAAVVWVMLNHSHDADLGNAIGLGIFAAECLSPCTCVTVLPWACSVAAVPCVDIPDWHLSSISSRHFPSCALADCGDQGMRDSSVVQIPSSRMKRRARSEMGCCPNKGECAWSASVRDIFKQGFPAFACAGFQNDFSSRIVPRLAPLSLLGALNSSPQQTEQSL